MGSILHPVFYRDYRFYDFGWRRRPYEPNAFWSLVTYKGSCNGSSLLLHLGWEDALQKGVSA